MTEKTSKDKQKLTLSISKDVIDKARVEGINISAITEKVLTAITFSPEKNTKDDLIEAYDNFFEALKPFLKKYGTSIRVGKEHLESGYFMLITLDGDSLVIEDPTGEFHKTSISANIDWLDSPTVILENLIPSLIQSAENNREKMKEFEISLRFLKALSADDNKDNKK